MRLSDTWFNNGWIREALGLPKQDRFSERDRLITAGMEALAREAELRTECKRLAAALVEAEKYNGWHQQAIIERDELRMQRDRFGDRNMQLEQQCSDMRAALERIATGHHAEPVQDIARRALGERK